MLRVSPRSPSTSRSIVRSTNAVKQISGSAGGGPTHAFGLTKRRVRVSRYDTAMKPCTMVAALFLISCGSSSRSPDAPVPAADAAPDAGSAVEAAAVEAGTILTDTGAIADVPANSADVLDLAAADAAPADVNSSEAGAQETGQAAPVDSASPAPRPTRVALFAAPATIIAAPYEDVVIFGQLQDDAGNPVLTSADPEAPFQVTLASSNELVLAPYYSAGDERGKLAFDRLGSPNWAYTYFKASSIPGSATVSGNAAGMTVVPVQITTVAQGGAATGLRIFAQPNPLPSRGTRGWFPVIQIVDSTAAPTYRTSSFDVTITSDDATVCAGGSLYFMRDFNWTMATISVPAAPGTATLTASAAGLSAGSAALTVVP
jgi:hypothetical protein